MRGTALFSCGNHDFTPDHVLAAARLWGARKELEDAVRDALAAQQWAEDAGWSPDENTLQARSVAFRRDYGLRSADVTHAWMTSRGVDLDDFCAYLEHCVCREAFEEQHAGTCQATPYPDEAMNALLWPQAVFSGYADEWCYKLAQQAAAAAAGIAVGPPHDADGSCAASESGHLHEILAAYEHFEEEIQSGARMEQVLRARWQDLFIVDCARAIFESEAAVREAYLCVREDGASLEAVAEEGGGDYARATRLLCDLPELVQTQILCAMEGEVLQPVIIDGLHVLYRIGSKSEPRLDDAQVHDAVAEIVLNQALRPLLKRHVQWHLSGNG